MKVARHEKMLELIKQYDIDTQEELAARLNDAGFKDKYCYQTNIHRLILIFTLSTV